MPTRIASLMTLIAIVGFALGAFLIGGRWYFAADESVQGSVHVSVIIFCVYTVVFGAILVPLYLFDAFQDAKARYRDALASRMAELDRIQSL